MAGSENEEESELVTDYVGFDTSSLVCTSAMHVEAALGFGGGTERRMILVESTKPQNLTH
ncbi:hypothetical protein M758_2G022000 [Ceratodon purpureus]|nr:hypothetical protein M758_2G022000 [Ceratodon purpureus]